MGSGGFYVSYNYWKYVFVYKAELLAGLFSALAVINYFYQAGKIEKEKKEVKLKILMFSLEVMGENDKMEFLQKTMDRIEFNVDKFMLKFESKFDELEEKYNALNLSINEKIAKLDKSQGITNAKIAIYISIIVSVGLTVFNITVK